MLSDVMEDYLKTIYILQRESDARVSTSAIAEHLDVTPPTVTSMIEKLADRGLLDYEKYQGVELTGEGETVALEVLRHHRLLEAFLADELAYDYSDVHDEADALEHHISEEFERRVAEALGDPTVDPHGDPIPDADLQPLGDDDTVALADCDTGVEVIVARVSDRNERELEYLAEVGIEPGVKLRVVDRTPLGLVKVDGDGLEEMLPPEVAETLRVRRDSGTAASIPDPSTET